MCYPVKNTNIYIHVAREQETVVIKKEMQKSRTMEVTVWDPSRKFIHLSMVIWYNKSSPGLAVPAE